MGDKQDIQFPSDPRIFVDAEYKALVKQLIVEDVPVPHAYYGIYYLLHIPKDKLDLITFYFLTESLSDDQKEQYFFVDGELWNLNSLILSYDGPHKNHMLKTFGWAT